MLGLTERTVLNHIKSKEIEAIKVGKKWHLNKASVESFQQRYGFSDSDKNTRTVDLDELEDSPNDLKNVNVDTLRCYTICKAAFRMPNWRSLEIENAALKARLTFLMHIAIESLGSGYHTFHLNIKAQYYEKSRAAVGAILAHLQNGDDDFVKVWKREISFLQRKMIPAYSALLRSIERKIVP